MGWSFAYSRSYGKAELVAEIRGSNYFAAGSSLVADRVVGNHFWGVVESPGGERWIFLALMASGGKESGWGSKTMSEACGPIALDCPLSLLKLAGPPKEGTYATKWREEVESYRLNKASRRNIKAGELVVYGETKYKLIKPCAPRKGWMVERIDDGRSFRMNSRQIAASEPVAVEVAQVEQAEIF